MLVLGKYTQGSDPVVRGPELANISRAKSFRHKRIVNKQKCHPMFYNTGYEGNNTSEAIITINSLCHGVGDNLYPP